MRGGQVFMDSLTLHGVEAIFGNPGTTENPLLDRLIDYPDITYYVALHEGVAVCAASFYAQARGRTALANLHVAPGLGNGIGMIYGALKARSPLIVTAGQQDTRMRLNEPLLSHDLVAMAAPVCKWSVEPASADEIGPIMMRAFKVANEFPAGPVFVALPVDVMEQETTIAASAAGTVFSPTASAEGLEHAVAMFRESTCVCIVTGDDPARAGAVSALVELAQAAGAAVYHEGLRAQVSFPNEHPNYRGRVAFEPAATAALLAPYDLVVLIGGTFFENVWFDHDSAIPPGARVLQIESGEQNLARNHALDLGLIGDLKTTLEALARELQVQGPAKDTADERNRQLARERESSNARNQAQLEKLWDTSPMSPGRAIHEIRSALPEETIVVDESITASLEVGQQIPQRAPGDFFAGRGGGIGQGVAGAIGVQAAFPGRRVLALSGDGSAMYSIQALWTAAHHDLPIVFVILSNREYRVLKHNLDIYRQRFDAASNKPYPHMDLTSPVLGFPEMAAGMGVPGERVSEAGDVAAAITRAFGAGTPYLVEIVISGKQ
jgi:benzoylformate decarboxylase